MFNEVNILTAIESLPTKHRLVFAVSCCERLFPFYSAFSKLTSFGDVAFLRGVLDRIWSHCLRQEFHEDEIDDLLSKCHEMIPDSEDYPTNYAGEAADASAAICCSLKFCIDFKPDLISTIARLTFEGVEYYLHIVNDPVLGEHLADPLFDDWLMKSPMLAAELKRQDDDLNLLKSSQMLSPELLVLIRDASIQASVDPRKRGLC